METFNEHKQLIEQAAQQMLTTHVNELQFDMNMVLVSVGSEEEKAHAEKGANRMSAHEIGGKQFVVFSS